MTAPSRASGITLGLVESAREVGPFVVSEAVHEGLAVLPPHEHENPSLTLVVQGAFVERVGDRTWECARGHIVAKPGGAKHANEYRAAGNREILIESRALDTPEMRAFDPAHLPHSPIPGIGERIAAEMRLTDVASNLVLHGWILHLIASVLRFQLHDERQQPQWLRDVRDRLHSCGEDISLDALATGANVHPVHLVRTFKRYLGMTPGAYLRRIRIDRACELLRTSNDSISRIATETGFAHHAHFTRTFLTVIGTTPSAYRRAHHHQKR
jgi:AraC family transcriptional regulator